MKEKNNKIYGGRIRLTEEEHKLLVQKAREFGHKNISTYIRHCLFEKVFEVKKTDQNTSEILSVFQKLQQDYSGFCKNFNQITRAVNAQKNTSNGNLEKYLELCTVLVEEIREGMFYVSKIIRKLEQ